MSTPVLSVMFTKVELNWLQINVEAFWEQIWAQMGNREEDYPAGAPYSNANEYGYLKDLLNKVRISLQNPKLPVVFTDPNELNFIKKYLTDYKNYAGEYIFTGPLGNNVRIGGFPTMTGAANSNFNGQGAFPESFFLTGQDVFNNILHKLGAVVVAPINPVYGSPGES